MWRTVFVIDGKEHPSDKDFPAFQTGGKVVLYLKDTFDDKNVPVGFLIKDIYYDVYASVPKQYVHMTKLETF